MQLCAQRKVAGIEAEIEIRKLYAAREGVVRNIKIRIGALNEIGNARLTRKTTRPCTTILRRNVAGRLGARVVAGVSIEPIQRGRQPNVVANFLE